MNTQHESQTFLTVDHHRIIRAECGTDGNWQVETFLPETKPATVAADPVNRGIFYAGTDGNGIYRSTDGGKSWTQTGLAGKTVKSIAVSPHDAKVIYAGVKPAAIYKSIDGGHTWQEMEGFRRIPNRWFWFSPAEPPFQAYVMAIAVSPQEPGVVLAGVELGAVVRSEDGGQTWSGHRRGALRDCHSLKFHANLGDWVFEAGGTGGGAAVSRDGGRTWRQPRAGLAKRYGVACAADPEQPEVWYVAVAPGPGKAYGQSPEAYLYRSTGGGDWHPIGWGQHPMGEMPMALVTIPGITGHLYAGTTAGHVWHSADFGATWSMLPIDLGSVGRSLLIV